MRRTRLINTQAAWETTAAKLSQEPELALDTESNSLHAYQERVCLVQIGAEEETFLLDPLAVKNVSALGDLLADPSIVKVLHGSDYDLRSLDRDYGFHVQSLFDTETAARFLGHTSPNLASVLETFLGVSIPKSKKIQRSNWAARPLTPLALEYAASDVHHSLPLAAELRRRLARLGRLEWVQEEYQRFEQARYTPPDPPEAGFLRARGAEQLDPQALAVFRELFLWRDAEAQRRDHPPFRVVSNEVLINLAQASVSGYAETPRTVLETVPGVPRQHQWGLQTAIEQGRAAPEVHRAPPARDGAHWTPECRTGLQRLKQWRARRAASLGLDPALVWPAVSLERLARHPQGWRTELLDDANPDVRAWQRREFGTELLEFLGAPD